MKKIFVIEDDENIRNLVKIAMEGYGHQVAAFETAEEALEELEKEKPDLAVFDLMLPGMDGLSAIRLIRERTDELKNIPIIVLTAKDKEYDKVVGLDGGADDYVTKPFGVLELAARVNALLRRSRQNASLVRGNLALDEDTMTATLRGVRLELNNKEFNLLKYLMQKEGKALTRENILNAVWWYDEGETRTVDNHVARLRKLGIDYIETVFGVGYKFVYRD